MIRSSNRNLTFSFLSWLLNLYEKASSQTSWLKAGFDYILCKPWSIQRCRENNNTFFGMRGRNAMYMAPFTQLAAGQWLHVATLIKCQREHSLFFLVRVECNNNNPASCPSACTGSLRHLKRVKVNQQNQGASFYLLTALQIAHCPQVGINNRGNLQLKANSKTYT